MGETSRRFLALLLTAVLFVAPGGAVAQDMDPADCNKDGRVDEVEAKQTECPVNDCGGDSPSICGDGDEIEHDDVDPRDCNEDGRIDDVEAKQTSCPDPRDEDEHEDVDETEGLDCNKDGRIDEKEETFTECPEMKDDPCLSGTVTCGATTEGMDCNKDGRIDEKEETFTRCPEPGTFEGDGDKMHPCDQFHDEPIRHERCMREFQERCDRHEVAPENAHFCKRPMDGGAPEGRPCDRDADGEVTDDEREACEERFRDKCDTNDDGRVDEFERRACAEAHDEFKREAVSAECRTALQEQGEERKAFEDAQRTKRDAFQEEHHTAYEEFSAEEHSDEEWAEFKEEQEAARQEFEDAMREARDAFETDNGRPEACADAGGDAAGGPCAPDPADYERFKRFVDGEDAGFRDDLDERVRKFEERQKEGNASDEERHKERARFERDLEEARLKHRAHLEGLWEEFRAKHSEDCIRGDRDDGMRDLNRDVKDERLQCRIDFQEKFDAFYETNGDDVDSWDDATLASYVALKAEVHAAVKECDERLHDAWKEGRHEDFNGTEEKERFGHFEVESEDGEGTATGRFVAFEFESGSMYIRDYSVQGLVLFEEFYSPADWDRPVAEGAELRADGKYVHEACEGDACSPEATRLQIHDNPNGRFAVGCRGPHADGEAGGEGDAGNMHVTFPDGVTHEESGGERGATKYALDYGDLDGILLVHGDHWWSGDGSSLEFACGMHVFIPGENFVHKFANKHRDEIDGAVEDGDILAEVNIVAGDGGDAEADTSEYEDAEVEVEDAGAGDGVVVTVEAEGNAGKTGVFNIDSALFDASDFSLVKPDGFVVDYWDVADDGTKTKVEIQEADSLTDILDPSEDHPEYWVVLDKDGVQLLVSFPHFSTHQVQIQSARVTQPDGSDMPEGDGAASTPFPGAVGLLAAVGVATALAMRRRK